MAALLAVLVAAVTPSVASAAPAPASAGALGYDISYPQCGAPLPTGGTFGIVGVNGGRAFSANPCLATQYKWATSRPNRAAVYINTGNPAPTSTYYWPASGSRDPALCKDNRSTTDPGCAYNYGWHAAADAVATARSVDPSMLGLTWWLDVETANSWNGDGVSNAADLQGALDYLRSNGVATVGLYSTAYQWRTITGGYTASSAATYKAAWASSFTPRHPMESAPLWIATGGDGTAAAAACSATFTGAAARMTQYHDGTGFDANLVCVEPAAAAAKPTAPGAPTSLSARPDVRKGVNVGWAAPSSNGGTPVRYYTIRRGSSATRTTPYSQVVCNTPTCTWKDTGTSRNATYFYTVTATTTVGTGPAPSPVSARAR